MLFLKECKKSICSLAFIVYVVAVFAMYFSQYGCEINTGIEKPVPGLDYYGSIEKEVPDVLMPAAIESLVYEYLQGSYVAYPFMFYKEVKLKEHEKERMTGIIVELTGLSEEELESYTDYEKIEYNTITYERFKELMNEADDIIGGGSKYSEKYLVSNFSQIPMTYEEALEEYEELLKEENIAEAYIRLFCDYAGIVLSIMPVFVCAVLWQSDKRANMEQLIYIRSVSSYKLIVTRYVALISCMILPIIITFLHAVLKVNKLYPEMNIKWGMSIGLAALWLLPTLLVVTSLGAFVSEVLSPLFAVFIQGVWWFVSLGMTKLIGNISKGSFIIRHNSLGDVAAFQRQYSDFVFNRTLYIFVSLILLAITVLIYEQQRKGRFNEGKGIFKNFVFRHKK